MQLAPNHFYQDAFVLKAAIAIGLIALTVIIAIIRYYTPNAGANKISRRAFRRRAIATGLSKNQTRLLEGFMGKVRQPANLLANTGELNRVLAEALRNCSESGNPMVSNRHLEIYRIKQRIDKVFMDGGNMTSSRQLRVNQKITFQQANGERFASWITANLKEFYCAGIPKNLDDKLTGWRKGSKTRLFILNIDGEEIVFKSKVLGYTNIMAAPSVILGHTVREKQSSIREHRRRAISGRMIIYPVHVVERGQGRKLVKRMFVANNPGLRGDLIDLSPGGCSISSRSPLNLEKLVKLILEHRTGESVAVFGKVVNTRVIDRAKNIIHVMFTKASVEDMNLINAYVYELG